MEPGPAELAVGDAAHPERLDLAHGGGDGLVLDGAQLGRGDGAGGAGGAGLVHGRRAQQAADVVGAERRIVGGSRERVWSLGTELSRGGC